MEGSVEDALPMNVETFNNHHMDNDIVVCITLASMPPKLQKQHDMNASEIILYSQELFSARSRTKSYDTSKELIQCNNG